MVQQRTADSRDEPSPRPTRCNGDMTARRANRSSTGAAASVIVAACLCLPGGRTWTLPPPATFPPFRGGRRRRRGSVARVGPRRPSATLYTSLYASSPSAPETPASILDDMLDEIDDASLPLFLVGERVGSGSYGTVHRGLLVKSKGDARPCVGKRAWTAAELSANVPRAALGLDQDNAVAQRTGLAVAQKTGVANAIDPNDNAEDAEPLSPSEAKARAERCRDYWDVERHCFQKMEDADDEDDGGEGGRAAPEFWGVYDDGGRRRQLGGGGETIPGYGAVGEDEGNGGDGGWLSGLVGERSKGLQWMVFEFIGSKTEDASAVLDSGVAGEPAPTLLDAMELDWKDQHLAFRTNNHLYGIQRALNLPESFTIGESLDAIFASLLENLKVIHACNIVHRDLKPGNLLCDASSKRLRLIDFGSAADLDPSPAGGNPFSGETRRVGYDEGSAPVSPVYSAPETLVRLDENPLSFDVFSAGLVMSQLVFNLLDERADAGFLQQLKEANYDLDEWLEKELGAKPRAAGFDAGLEYLGERRGLWALLKRMFEPDPTKRITSSRALERFDRIVGLHNGEIEWSDSMISDVAKEESYFETVIESFDGCSFHYGLDGEVGANMPRALHFIASFRRGTPIGLALAEASEVEDDGCMSPEERDHWVRATRNALPGEVFVRGLEPGGQAEELGIFEVGDRLRGIGELPFVDGGFEQAIKLIDKQPANDEFLKMHFDRISTPKAMPKSDEIDDSTQYMRVSGQGAWKSGGRRGAQEDAFVLHEIKNEEMGDILLAGVFDGHAGTAASKTAESILPSLFTAELLADGSSIEKSIGRSWENTCTTYRSGCDDNGECVAYYDPREGIIFAETGSNDIFVAGTTATVAAIPMNPCGAKELTILNCGDSRTLVVGDPGPDSGESAIVFETRDHSPDDEIEIERLEKGLAEGLDYSVPQCSMTSGSYMVVGDYQYALCRSLEGTYVTSKGIVSDPDVTTLDLSSSLAAREHCAVVLACDGLFEVMSNEEVGREVTRMRKEGYFAGDISKNLCGQALKKGSYDNLSVVVVNLDAQ
ncbi:hypothetical protein ACHAWF_011038 [Thalassiosira exigua]